MGHYTSGPAFWLILYFFFNLSLTLYNKSVLIRFPFPYTLTALHALCSTIGSYLARQKGYFTPANVTSRQSVMLLAFSVLYTVNIAVSNLSLQMVTIPFHQVVRSTTPLFTIVLSSVILRTRFTLPKLVSLIPVVAGVGLATYGDYYFTLTGLLLTLLGTVLAALKTICTNLLQVPPAHISKPSLGTPTPPASAAGWSGFRLQAKLHPLDLLLRMSPLAFIQCVLFAQVSGELERVRAFSSTNMSRANLLALLVNGMIAFGLNVVSFTANKKTGALTMTVAGMYTARPFLSLTAYHSASNRSDIILFSKCKTSPHYSLIGPHLQPFSQSSKLDRHHVDHPRWDVVWIHRISREEKSE